MRIGLGHRFFSIAITVLVLGGVFWWTQRGSITTTTLRPMRLISSTTSKQQKPEDVIWAMLKACQMGDMKHYLGCFEGDLKKRLIKLSAEQGKAPFQNHLKQLIAPIKGVALIDAISSEGGVKEREDEARLKVEYVLAERNEVQIYQLRKLNGSWKVVQIEMAQRIPTLIPYGAKVWSP